jgi:hypothetical protein
MTVTAVIAKYKSGIHCNLETFFAFLCKSQNDYLSFYSDTSEGSNRDIKGVIHTGIHGISACILCTFAS